MILSVGWQKSSNQIDWTNNKNLIALLSYFEGQSTNALWLLILNPRVRDDTNPPKCRTVFVKCSIFFLVEITVSVTSIFSVGSQDNLIFKEKRTKTNNHTHKTHNNPPNKKKPQKPTKGWGSCM